MRSYKQKEERLFKCTNCSFEFLTRANRILRCTPCSKINEFSKNMLNIGWRLNKLISNAKHRSKDKDLDFNLDLDHIMYLWNSNKGKCCITGRVFDLSKYGEKGQVSPNAPSIDRIIPKLGYTIGNVRLVTYHVNVALSEFGLENLLTLSEDILKIK